jgi:hypothetical protein
VVFARNFNALAHEGSKEAKSHLPQTTEFALFFVHIQTGVTKSDVNNFAMHR